MRNKQFNTQLWLTRYYVTCEQKINNKTLLHGFMQLILEGNKSSLNALYEYIHYTRLL